jgi:TorA maturation chaperone TorD
VINEFKSEENNKLLKEVIPFSFLKPPGQEEIREIALAVGDNPNLYDITEVNKEFVRFFRVPGEDYLPPYESYWILKPHPEDLFNVPRLYSQTTQEIRNIYKALGIYPLESFNEPPDHIAYELSVYFTIAPLKFEKKEKIPQTLLEVIDTFVNEHFKKWVPGYLEKLSLKTKSSNSPPIFYSRLASFLLEKI